ncbi:MAG: hypothetical protein ACRBB5_03960 [Nitrosopumilus sp.]
MLLVIPLISILFFLAEDPIFSLLATFAAYIITLIMRPFVGAFFGNFGDKHGRKKTIMIFAMTTMLVAIPAFYGIYHADSTFERASYTIILIIVTTIGFGPIPVFYLKDFQQKLETVQMVSSIMED